MFADSAAAAVPRSFASHEPPLQETGEAKHGSWLGERTSSKTSPNGTLKTSPVRFKLCDARLSFRKRARLISLRARCSSLSPQNALQRVPINVPRSNSSEMIASLKDGDEITPREALSTFASEFAQPPPRSARPNDVPFVDDQPLDQDDDETPMEADAVRCHPVSNIRFTFVCR